MERQIEGNIVDIHHRDIFPGRICMENGRIVSITRTAKRYDDYILPGFIDAHVHIESSMLTPTNFSRLVISKGTVAVVNDPHEIANVLGKEGVDFMLDESREALIKMFFTIPSCVPATEYDFPGGRLSSGEVEVLAKSGRFVGLSEMMNVPGVLRHQLEPMRKISIAHRYGFPVDGHAPGLTGEDLKKYVRAGISTDHECVTLDEALEKINAGMKILIREGSASKNYEALKSLIASHPEAVMFCTDDAHPGDIVHLGHIDKMVRRAVSDGFDLFDVLQVACIHPVLHYHLPVGLLRVDDSADFIVVRDLKSFEVRSVYLSGEEKYRFGMVFQPKREVLASYPNQFFVNCIVEEQLQQA
ncbi:MAG: amidohydrolase family protein, partial [Odoribacter sp.]|nr:amidohydrolase family protein [Odoribacter sp.]